MGMDKLPNENMQMFIEFPKGSGISKTTLKTFLKSAISKKIKGVISLSLKASMSQLIVQKTSDHTLKISSLYEPSSRYLIY